MRTILLALACLATPVWADSLEFSPGYRSGLQNHWRGTEFNLSYWGKDYEGWSWGAYASSTLWRIEKRRRGDTLEGGPQLRYTWALEDTLIYGGAQASILSTGEFNRSGQTVGARIYGPRLNLGALYPIGGFILNFGVTKGWETLRTYSESHEQEPLASHSVFVGISS